MSEQKCPTCGALCNVVEETIYPEPHSILIPMQPDMTGIRAVYEKYKHLDTVLSDQHWDDDIRGHIRYELWQAVKGICKEES